MQFIACAPDATTGPVGTVSASAWTVLLLCRDLIGSILLGPLDHFVGDTNRQLSSRVDVAAIVNTGPDARLGRLFAKRGEHVGIAWEQITKHPRDRD